MDCKRQFTQLCVTQFGFIICNLRSIAWHTRNQSCGQNKWKIPPPHKSKRGIILDFGGMGVGWLLFHFILSKVAGSTYTSRTSSLFSEIIEQANYASVRENLLP